jgi:Spy/CpxP family protein refolding chaperone
MRIVIRILMIAAAVSSAAYAQTSQTPYAGEDKREIKALSPDEIQAYQNGQGMGFAKAAELNQFPGPKHVLELATELKLTDQQKTETQQIYDRMHTEAVRLGDLIIGKEKALDHLFTSKQINSQRLRQTVADISRLQGELRVLHLQAHLETRRILSPDQIKQYDGLRGYGSEHKDHQHKH